LSVLDLEHRVIGRAGAAQPDLFADPEATIGGEDREFRDMPLKDKPETCPVLKEP
jgi:hypothetical protein